jgi:hypothetical protein
LLPKYLQITIQWFIVDPLASQKYLRSFTDDKILVGSEGPYLKIQCEKFLMALQPIYICYECIHTCLVVALGKFRASAL